MPPFFCVATILNEPLPTTLRFVAWYLEQGADRIILFFDNPQDPAIDLLMHHAQVDCVACTPAFWEQLGTSPDERFTRRQNLALGMAYAALESGWFLNVDSDELLYLEGRKIRSELEQTPQDVAGIRVLPAEKIQTPDHPGMSCFRLPMQRWARRKVYPTEAHVVARRLGLAGHTVGKSLTRAGLKNVNLRQHWVERADETAITDRVLGPQDGAYLLHFFDQGYDVWRRKLDWRLSSRGYRQRMRDRIEAIMAQDDPEPELRALYDALHVFDADRVAILEQVRACVKLPLVVDDYVENHFPGVTFR